jgi:hypothetical protein
MERPALPPGPNAKPSQPRVRTVGFSVYGEERADEPDAAYVDDSPLPVMIPPAFQARAARRGMRRARAAVRMRGGVWARNPGRRRRVLGARVSVVAVLAR